MYSIAMSDIIDLPTVAEPTVADILEPTVADTTTLLHISNNKLSLAISVAFTLSSFDIVGVNVVPNTSADIYIVITASNGTMFERTVPLRGDAYTAWTYDSYLYEYIQTNIATIYNS